MTLISLAVIWLGLALLFTVALCRAASGPIPKPNFPAEAQTAIAPNIEP